MGRTGETCGAVTGAVMVISLAKSAHDRAGCSGEKQAGTLASRLISEFRKRHSSVLCRELLGTDISAGDDHDSHLFERCPRFVHDAAEIIEEMMMKTGARVRGVK